MQAGFTITNNSDFTYSEIILVFNYHQLNIIENIPVCNNSRLLDFITESFVGIWKIKKLK